MPPVTPAKVKNAIGKREIKRLGNRKKSGTGGNKDRQEEDATEVLSEQEGDDMSATGIEADPVDEPGHDGSASGSSATGSSTLTSLAGFTLSSVNIEKTIEASQSKNGQCLLEESNRRWGKKAAAHWDKHDRRMSKAIGRSGEGVHP